MKKRLRKNGTSVLSSFGSGSSPSLGSLLRPPTTRLRSSWPSLRTSRLGAGAFDNLCITRSISKVIHFFQEYLVQRHCAITHFSEAQHHHTIHCLALPSSSSANLPVPNTRTALTNHTPQSRTAVSRESGYTAAVCIQSTLLPIMHALTRSRSHSPVIYGLGAAFHQ